MKINMKLVLSMEPYHSSLNMEEKLINHLKEKGFLLKEKGNEFFKIRNNASEKKKLFKSLRLFFNQSE